MRRQNWFFLVAMMFGLGGCQPPCETEPHRFENEVSDVRLYDIIRTMERLETDNIAEISCEELCYPIEGGEYAIDYGISDCSMELDPEIVDTDLETADITLIAGTVTCTGFVVNPCK